ncbi:MAG: HAD family hydrolase [Thermosipho sp. (in: Bacteria)]|nr:HAD family hydrolase [Thermosipho sp. (in: thermotogales)]
MIFVFDLDGTLLLNDYSISKNMIKIISNLDKKGHKIIFASGRMLVSINQLINKFLKKEYPIIAYNGAMVYLPKDGIIFEKNIDFEISKFIIEFLRKKNIHRQAYINDKLYSEEDNEEVKFYSKHANVEYHVVKDLVELIKQKNPTKLLAIDSPENLNILLKELRELDLNVEIFKSMNIFLDIVPKNINKAHALNNLLKHMNCLNEKIIVFGDNHNDIPLFKIADISFAVENAVDELKDIADFVIPASYEDGVFQAFNTFLKEYIK